MKGHCELLGPGATCYFCPLNGNFQCFLRVYMSVPQTFKPFSNISVFLDVRTTASLCHRGRLEFLVYFRVLSSQPARVHSQVASQTESVSWKSAGRQLMHVSIKNQSSISLAQHHVHHHGSLTSTFSSCFTSTSGQNKRSTKADAGLCFYYCCFV